MPARRRKSRSWFSPRLVFGMGMMLTTAITCKSHGILLPGDAGRVGVQQLVDTRRVLEEPSAQLSGCAVVRVSHGSSARHTCAILADGSLRCWGYNLYGQLGLNSTNDYGDAPESFGSSLPSVALGTNRTATQVAVGGGHTCVVLDTGDVKCWGNNTWGQLGLPGTSSNRGDVPGTMGDYLPPVALGTGRTAQQVVTGMGHTCVLLDTGGVKCWGYGGYGQLGGNSTSDVGGMPNTMGDALPWVDLGSGRTARQLTAGDYHTCALLDDSSVKCWGFNQHGELGIGKLSSGILGVGNTPGYMGDNLPSVAMGSGRSAKYVTAGWGHTCALLDDNTVKCWGMNVYGQLGIGNNVDHGGAPATMGDNLPAVSLGTGARVQQVHAGQQHTCAVLQAGQVKCWGRNNYGQLGLNDTVTRGVQSIFMGDALQAVALGSNEPATDVTAGTAHSCALLRDGGVKCWGLNSNGQLGQGDVFSRGNSLHSLDDLAPIQLCTQQGSPVPANDPVTAQQGSAATESTGGSSGAQLATGVIAGIAVGSVVLLALVIAVLAIGYKRHKAKDLTPPSSPAPRLPTLPQKHLPRTEGDAFRHLTSQVYSWVWSTDLTQPVQLVEAGINDVQHDVLLHGGVQRPSSTTTGQLVCPVVQLNAVELHEQIHLLADGLIGRGGASLVFKCIWPSRFGDNKLLAAKVLRDGYDADPTMLQSFVEEASVLAATQHRNVIKLYGFCLEPPTVCLILELLPTSLKDLLHRAPRSGLPFARVTSSKPTSTGHVALQYASNAVQFDNGGHSGVLTPVHGQAARSSPATSSSDNTSPDARICVTHTHTMPSTPKSMSPALHPEYTTLVSPATPTSHSSMVSSLKPSSPLALEQIINISKDIAAALAYLHNVGLPSINYEDAVGRPLALQPLARFSSSSPRERIVHRDIKPANILINSAGVAKVTDFGLARVHESTTIMTSHVGAGTLPYMAPELLLLARTGGLGQGATNRVDIYSMGILMWEMLTGQMPWYGMRGEAIHAAVLAGQRPQLWDEDMDASTGYTGHANSGQHAQQGHVEQQDDTAHVVSCKLASIIRACWQQRDLRRPSAAQLFELLAELHQQLDLPASSVGSSSAIVIT